VQLEQVGAEKAERHDDDEVTPSFIWTMDSALRCIADGSWQHSLSDPVNCRLATAGHSIPTSSLPGNVESD
jgi:hypothetical protein